MCGSDPRIGALPHVGRLVDDFRFSLKGWTLVSASKRGFVSKLDEIRGRKHRYCIELDDTRFHAGIHGAVENGFEVRVLSWWIDTFVTRYNAQAGRTCRPCPKRVMNQVLGVSPPMRSTSRDWTCSSGSTKKPRANSRDNTPQWLILQTRRFPTGCMSMDGSCVFDCRWARAPQQIPASHSPSGA